ncbi:hypothetical protein FZEAL_7664 [Fusarium zealandicum]|uniref:Uncharacterized protein n=1 Tax=Fusarium zealandicum TaxID=1053134 RepID=A0A8H4UFB5_9HYPO|nr:hypothetical protein FZEAL_7664 [Fusarium zealandicum]
MENNMPFYGMYFGPFRVPLRPRRRRRGRPSPAPLGRGAGSRWLCPASRAGQGFGIPHVIDGPTSDRITDELLRGGLENGQRQASDLTGTLQPRGEASCAMTACAPCEQLTRSLALEASPPRTGTIYQDMPIVDEAETRPLAFKDKQISTKLSFFLAALSTPQPQVSWTLANSFFVLEEQRNATQQSKHRVCQPFSPTLPRLVNRSIPCRPLPAAITYIVLLIRNQSSESPLLHESRARPQSNGRDPRSQFQLAPVRSGDDGMKQQTPLVSAIRQTSPVPVRRFEAVHYPNLHPVIALLPHHPHEVSSPSTTKPPPCP